MAKRQSKKELRAEIERLKEELTVAQVHAVYLRRELKKKIKRKKRQEKHEKD